MTAPAATAAAANLAAGGQAAVPSGGIVLSGNYSDANLINLGYVKMGRVDSEAYWDQRADGPWPATQTSPTARYLHAAVWTASEMIVWGGVYIDGSSQLLNGGGRYDPVADTWTALSATGAPTARHSHTAIWTGNEIIVWGGFDNNFTNTGGRYKPVTDSWTTTSTTGAPSGRSCPAGMLLSQYPVFLNKPGRISAENGKT